MSLLAALPLVPLAGGLLLWPAGRRWSRARLATAALGTLAVTGAAAGWAAVARPESAWRWGGALELGLAVTAPVAVMTVLVVAVTATVVAYTVGHEPDAGLSRLVGLLVAFCGTMLLLVLAADLLTLLIGFELTAAASWALIAHDWRDRDAPSAAAHAFNTTRFGSLGLLLAAGAAVAATGSLRLDALTALDGWTRHAFAVGVLVAAATKSAQVPFAPWLFSAMAGPTPVSALLHSATMVAAGAWILIRLNAPLATVSWFGPAAVSLGLATALAGGVVAGLQPRAKHLLAASTSAHHGLMIAAVGAGAAGAGLAHLVAHAAAKALLFLAAGVALAATGSALLADHHLGRLRGVAAAAWVGALALAGVPPLGAAWTKEEVLAGLGHVHPGWAVVGAVAGGLSAFYAVRFALLSFGGGTDRRVEAGIGSRVVAPLAVLAAASVGLGALWLAPDQLLPDWTALPFLAGKPWEIALSLGLVAAGAYGARALHQRGALATLGLRPAVRLPAADWLGLPTLAKRGVVDPTLALARGAARFDDAVVDAGVELAGRAGAAIAGLWSRLLDRGVDAVVEGVARATDRAARSSVEVDDRGVDGAVRGVALGVGEAGRGVRRSQTGMTHHYYAIVAVGLVLTVAVLALLR